MLRQAGVLVGLAVGATVWSACVYDFTIPGDTNDDDPSHACAANQDCKLNCGGGICGPTCAAGSTCDVQCGGGICKPYCAATATCHIQCGGGDCRVDCQGKCTVDCGGGICHCEGPGCP